MKRAKYNTDDADRPDDLEQSRMMRKQEYKRQEARGWFFSLAAAILIALTLRFFVFEFVRVDGESMLPTLYTNEYVFMEKVTYWFSGPQRGDIIICSYPGHTDTYVKRVIGMEGDRVRITGGVLYINDEANYDYYTGPMNNDMDEVAVPEAHVFVMGDNRNASMDSTNSGIGPLPYSMVQGKALFVIYPFDNIHGL
jgi:signal peptidase I, bacterial type